MAQVYKFRVKLNEVEEIIWRDIEITSVSNVAKLGYTILAAFETTASHLFCINYHGKRYEFSLDEDVADDETVMNPAEVKLSAFELSVADELFMEIEEFKAAYENIDE